MIYPPSNESKSVDHKLSDLQLAWQPDKGKFQLDLWIRRALKWAESSLEYRSVFSGSNDRHAVRDLDTICAFINIVSKHHSVILISVIGGCFFFDFCERADFHRVLLFDNNINEFAKITAVLNRVVSDSKSDPFKAVERELASSFESLLPKLSMSDFSIKFDERADWIFEERSEPAFPVHLRSDNFPNYAWRGFDDTRTHGDITVIEGLKSRLSKTAYPDVPLLDLEGSLAVVFLSNVGDYIRDDYVLERLEKSCGVVIVRSGDASNDTALNPHPYWEAIARSCLRGTSHHIWSPEDAGLIGSIYDKTTGSSSCLSNGGIPPDAETVLLHILLGKCQNEPIEDRMVRINIFLNSLPITVRRLVIAEFNPTEVMLSDFNRRFLHIDNVLEFYSQAVEKSFYFLESRFSPGYSSIMRNAFFIFERSAKDADPQ